ncbi:permease-like cell division protein FtsX [Bengtsoniella intestinalis]|uniref:permease-like cell division protein FtsX n=1 Tax=Bengtsoniella intestinalis TaxID=3073143 RepID=UPI00391F947A
MARHNFRYFAKEGVMNMVSHGFMSFAAVGMTVACLLIMGTFSLVAVNADAQLLDLEQDNEILAYVEETYSTSQAMALQSQLEAIDNVLDVTFISREEAKEAFIANYPEEELYQDLDANILRDRYAIRVVDLEQLSATVKSVQGVEGVVNTNAFQDLADGFTVVRNIATMVSVALIGVLFLVSVFIISNTIKLTTFDRREEIAIMRMVGATNGFIRWPFVYEGFLLGIGGAIIAFLFQWGLYEAVATGIGNTDSLQLISIIEFSEIWVSVAMTFVIAGIVIGVGGSLSAIRKFLLV